MGSRKDLNTLLAGILGSAERVYFQPPPSVQMQYPAIVYKRESANSQHADNVPYIYTKRYQVTYIDKNPDSDIPDKIAQLPLCLFSRHFTVDNLNHDVFNLYY